METCECKLAELRQKIDLIDNEIISCIERRMEVAEEIGKVKREMGLDVLQEGRRTEVVERWKRQSTLPSGLVEEIYGAIHRAAVEVQKYEKTDCKKRI